MGLTVVPLPESLAPLRMKLYTACPCRIKMGVRPIPLFQHPVLVRVDIRVSHFIFILGQS